MLGSGDQLGAALLGELFAERGPAELFDEQGDVDCADVGSQHAGVVRTAEVAHVLFIRADVAAVKVRQVYTSSNGQPSESEGEGSPLFLMAKEDGQWRLVACQNTPVVDS